MLISQDLGRFCRRNLTSRSAKYQANTRLRARFLFVLTNLKTLKRRLGG